MPSEDAEIKCKEEIASLLSYFVRELSQENITSDEALVYAGPSLDMYTKDVAVVAAVWLEHLIYQYENYEEYECFWSSFKPWLKNRNPMLYDCLMDFEEREELWEIFKLESFEEILGEYYQRVEETPRDLIVEQLLEELKNAQEYVGGPEMNKNIAYFEGVKVAAQEYIKKYEIKLPPVDSYIDVLPFHYGSEEMKFREQIQYKRESAR